jgi:hypothetical protein
VKLEKWALIAEVVGGIAIVLSLIFVGYEVRQSSQTNVQTLTQAMVSDYMAGVVSLSDTPTMACIFGQAMQNYDSLRGSERAMFNVRILAVFSAFQEMHTLNEQGAFDSSIWNGFEGLMTEALSNPGMRQWWSIRDHVFGNEFRAFIDAILLESPVVEPSLYNDASCFEAETE